MWPLLSARVLVQIGFPSQSKRQAQDFLLAAPGRCQSSEETQSPCACCGPVLLPDMKLSHQGRQWVPDSTLPNTGRAPSAPSVCLSLGLRLIAFARQGFPSPLPSWSQLEQRGGLCPRSAPAALLGFPVWESRAAAPRLPFPSQESCSCTALHLLMRSISPSAGHTLCLLFQGPHALSLMSW